MNSPKERSPTGVLCEHMMTGGLTAADGTRTDVYLSEVADGTMSLHLVTGNADICVVDCTDRDITALAGFLSEVVAGRTERAS